MDRGPGFPTGKIDAMRSPFVREQSSDDGIGIGLAIVDTLIRKHDGEMILSNAAHGGACITLRFPDAASSGLVGPSRYPTYNSGIAMA